MSITGWITRDHHEANKPTTDAATQAAEMRKLQDYAEKTSEAMLILTEIDSLLSAPKVEFNINYNRRVIIPSVVGGYSALEIIFDKHAAKPICATLIK